MKTTYTVQQVLAQERRVRWERFVARGGHPVLLMDTIRRSHLGFLKRVLGIPNLRYWKRYAETSFFSERELDRVRGSLASQLRHNPVSIAHTITRLSRIMHGSIKWAKITGGRTFRRMSDQALWNLAQKVFRQTDYLWTSAYFPMIADQVIKTFLLREGMREEEIGRSTIPATLTLLQKKQNAFFRLRERYGNRMPKTVLDRLHREYGWVRSYVLHIRPYTIREIQNDVQRATSLARRTSSPIPSQWQRLKTYLLVGQTLAAFRDARLFFVTQFFYYLRPFFLELARRLHVTYDEMIQMTSDEIFTRTVRRKEIAERQKGVAYLVLDGVPYICVGKHLRALERRDEAATVRVLHGVTAYPGHVYGKTRKVNPYNYKHIKKGDVIVTGMTTPEIAPFLSRIAAIVTDEGGITAHAAIVAREYKIPCVMGTKIATRVFKDGDRVEVDTERGIVRKI